MLNTNTDTNRDTDYRLLAREMTTRLHLSIGRTGRTAVHDITVVTEDTRELLGDVRATVSTASTC